jgi:hypothetical protein
LARVMAWTEQEYLREALTLQQRAMELRDRAR